VIGGNVHPLRAQALIDGADATRSASDPPIHSASSPVGVPQITAVYCASLVAREAGICGHRRWWPAVPGDIAKALVAARTPSCSSLPPAATKARRAVFVNGKQFKTYRGMGRFGALQTRGNKTSCRRTATSSRMSSDDKSSPKASRAGPYRGRAPWPTS
jgi:IMP dehydrogenase